MFGRDTIIEIILRRGRCEHCDGALPPPKNWIGIGVVNGREMSNVIRFLRTIPMSLRNSVRAETIKKRAYGGRVCKVKTSYISAEEKMTGWVNSVTTSKLTCFNRFIRTLVNYQEQITHYLSRDIPADLSKDSIIE